MATARNFEISDKLNVVGICTSRNHANKWISTLYYGSG
jgi:hypothetical protein